jgi:hypothetical protein
MELFLLRRREQKQAGIYYLSAYAGPTEPKDKNIDKSKGKCHGSSGSGMGLWGRSHGRSKHVGVLPKVF